VAGVLRGSDAALKDTYVLVTAHYDHLGVKPYGDGDRIYNGANDDGSGTVSVIELAGALAQEKERPRRSIVFMTFFGEEEGLVGSRYYSHHPLFPAEKTVADINLEQMGRIDATEGRQIATASPTGFGYTNLTDYFRAAGDQTGVKINHSHRSDLYFEDSDNLSLAQIGVPAETLCVAFQFPDYHAVGDEWEKIDYDNMAKVDRMVALSVLMIANNSEPPRWKESSATAPYVKAWKAHHP
jgi:Zn-dependent M28 family amino/carboxypeptidase